MAPKVFLTGATGYIGGDLLYALQKKHSDWDITCLVRNADKGAKIAALHSKARLVYGSLDSIQLLEEEAGEADIIYHCASADHIDSVKAFARALRHRTADNPAFYIHTSGTGILSWETLEKEAYGRELPKVYNDWEGISEVTSLPDSAQHRLIDKVVLEMSSDNPEGVKTAIVAPPCIYGDGRGPDNQRSIQAYEAAKAVLQQKRGFLPVKGENVWHQVHVRDLATCFVLLGESAAARDGAATWNQEGYYFAENGSFVWRDIFQTITRVAKQKGLIDSDETSPMPYEQLTEILPGAAILWASNSRAQAIRARKLLGWNPQEQSLKDEIPHIVDQEARVLGLIEGHAAKVAA